jgi:hypothetical protein
MARDQRSQTTDDPLGGIGATAAFVVFAALITVAFCLYASSYVN